jgi:hypothetical protein
MIMNARLLVSATATAVFACVLSNTGAAASTLYERLGGYGAISAVVDATIEHELVAILAPLKGDIVQH